MQDSLGLEGLFIYIYDFVTEIDITDECQILLMSLMAES